MTPSARPTVIMAGVSRVIHAPMDPRARPRAMMAHARRRSVGMDARGRDLASSSSASTLTEETALVA